jgi:hypothetical protein
MTDDLVKRLREGACLHNQLEAYDLTTEAANRIEELEAALKKNAQHHMRSIEIAMDVLRPGGRIKDADWDTLEIERMHGYARKDKMIDAAASPIDDLHERIKDLEYALRSIAEVPIGKEIPDRTTILELAKYMHETAKDALKEGKDEPRR